MIAIVICYVLNKRTNAKINYFARRTYIKEYDRQFRTYLHYQSIFTPLVLRYYVRVLIFKRKVSAILSFHFDQ